MNRNGRDARIAGLAFTAVVALAGCGGTSGYSSGNTGATGSTGAFQLWSVPAQATALTSDQRAAFQAGNLYYNAHTTAHSGGEIRGQLDKIGTVKVATLDGAQETPPVTTSAFGAGAFVVDESTGKISGFIVTSGLVNATEAHVHLGARGAPGSIIVPLSGGPDVWVVPDGAAPLSAAQIQAWQAGQLYVNAHTAANTGGEIRGQLDKAGTVRFAALDGSQETPATTSTGHGSALLVVDDTTGKPGGFIVTSGLVSPTAAHVHQGAAGAAGSIILPLTGGSGLWVVPDGASAMSGEQRTAFTSGGLYYNVHTAANGGGEIRGQLTGAGTMRFASLDPGQETPPVSGSSGFGAGILAVNDASGQPSGFLVTAGLTSPIAAHVHPAARGTAGPILTPLTGP